MLVSYKFTATHGIPVQMPINHSNGDNFPAFNPGLNFKLLMERVNHICKTKLPSPKELNLDPYRQWRVSRFMCYYNIYDYLRTNIYKFTSKKKASVLDVGGSMFLKPLNASMNITFTRNPGTDIHDTKFPSNSFDMVAADMVIEHLLYPQAAMKEIHRILKPGGLAIVTTVSYNPLHEEKHYHDMWRFLPDGLKILSAPFQGGIKICGSWGSKEFVRTRSMYGVLSKSERQIFTQNRVQMLTTNDFKNPVMVWMIVEK